MVSVLCDTFVFQIPKFQIFQNSDFELAVRPRKERLFFKYAKELSI